MNSQIILNTENVILKYHPDTKIVHHQFLKPVEGEVFREILNTGLEAFKEHGANKWLSDDRRHTNLPDADTQWAKEDWFPRVLDAGWKHWALVLPLNVTGMMNLKDFADTYRQLGLVAMLFSDPQKAQIWLEHVKN